LNNISGLAAGDYTLTITDSNQCTLTEIINLTEPGKLGMNFNLSQSIAGGYNLNCAGDINGSIEVEPVNQVKTVEYMWSDGLFGKIRTDLAAGNYTIIIKDANNCYASSTVTLTQPDSMKIDTLTSKPSCPDRADGWINLTVTGGVKGTDYFYKWSDNSTGSSLTNIPRGLYTVTVMDLNGCSARDSIIIEYWRHRIISSD
jgi:hypothetical protein